MTLITTGGMFTKELGKLLQTLLELPQAALSFWIIHLCKDNQELEAQLDILVKSALS